VAFIRDAKWTKRLYVLLLNKFYVDEIYDRYVVRPNLRFAEGLWHKIEMRVVNQALNLIGSITVMLAAWLLRVLEGRGIDRAVHGTSTASMSMARWLWRVLEGRALQSNVDRLGRQADAVGHFLQHTEVHTLQQHLLLIVAGLAGILGLFYLLVLGD
jgi:NADH:ubiquinone oxidoreductase subunit 5 (subunit L)/multisubunit Na+/H+ antiporter MnhA subunit